MMAATASISISFDIGMKIRKTYKRLVMMIRDNLSKNHSQSHYAEQQFSVLIKRYSPLINRICFSYSDNAEDMKDLRQDVYINIWKGLASFRKESSEMTWIYRVVLNTCVSTIRKKKRRVTLSSFDSILTDIPNDEEYDSYKDSVEQLHFAISTLTPLEKAIITMWLDEQSYEEIAAVCGLNRNTLAVKINRIKTKIKNNYER